MEERQEKRTKLEAIKAFYEEGDSPKTVKLKNEMYKQISKGPFNRSEFYDVGDLFGFFDKWSLLCLNGYLPIWVFEGNPGHTLLVFYDYTKDYILERRTQEENANPNYALAIEKLALKVKKKYYKQSNL